MYGFSKISEHALTNETMRVAFARYILLFLREPKQLLTNNNNIQILTTICKLGSVIVVNVPTVYHQKFLTWHLRLP
jgi:hypothetical protein